MRSSIYVKFMLILAPALVVAMMLAGYFITQYRVMEAQERIAARTGGQVARMASFIAQTDLAHDPATANKLLSLLTFDRAIVCAEVMDGDHVLAGIMEPRAVGCAKSTTQFLSLPIADTTYELRAGLSFEEIGQVRADARRTTLILALVGLFYAAIAATFAFRIVVGGPMARLLAGMRPTVEPRAPAIVENGLSDEMGEAIDAFNAMQVRLDEQTKRALAGRGQIERLYNSTPALLFTIDRNGLIQRVSDFWLATTGYARDRVLGADLGGFVSEESRAGWLTEVRENLVGGRGVRNVSLRIMDAAGRPIDVDFSALPHHDGEEPGDQFICVMTDVTRLKTIESELRALAATDRLTGLPNRASFDEALRRLVDAPVATRDLSAVLLVDLDNFKQINDLFGHAVGDAHLQDVGRRISSAARSRDFVARLGGDEFAVICPAVGSEAEASAIAERIVASLTLGLPPAFTELRVGASVGVAFLTHESTTADALLRQADRAMYAAKRGGKGRHATFAEASAPVMADANVTPLTARATSRIPRSA